MKCPYCSSENTRVIDKRKVEGSDSNRRRRECIDCSERFTTYERMEKTNRISKIQKRDGRVVNFEQERITNAIFKAAQAVGGKDREMAKELSGHVVELINKIYDANEIPSVEVVQDIVEKVLIENGHAKTAKAYILYRNQHRVIRETKHTILNIEQTMNEYLDKSDWRVNENSNIDFSIGGLILYVSGKITANYWLKNIYPSEIGDAHKNGDFHIHDLSMFSAYCAGWSLRQLVLEGFGGVPGQLQTTPAKHLDTLIGQMVNFLGTLQNEWAGAQAFSSVDTYLAPFIKKEGLTYKEVKQQIQRLLFNIATPSRWGTQTPFINFTFDWIVSEDLKDQAAIVGGEPQDFTYGDCQKELDMINKAFIEGMTEGDASGRIFTFPIPTYNITKDFDWDSENSKLLFEMTAKYGIPYFQNFINSDLKPSDVRSMCCRLQMDMRELRKKTGGLFGSGELTGSIGVVTINLARLGYLAKTKEDFLQRLGRLMELAKTSLEIKREVVTKSMDNGLLPYSKRYLGSFKNHFSTIGLCGMDEGCLNFLGKGIGSAEGRTFAIEVLDFMRKKMIQYQEETGNFYNLEATPAEGTSYRFAKIDKEKYPDIITAGVEEPFYTNSTALPVDYTDDVFEALQHQDELQTRYTGGTVLHCYLGERLDDAESCKVLVKRVAENFRLPYFTITPTFSICKAHGYLRGEQTKCPHCGTETEVYSRAVGYIRPLKQWNKGKKEEFAKRKTFVTAGAVKTPVSTEVTVAH